MIVFLVSLLCMTAICVTTTWAAFKFGLGDGLRAVAMLICIILAAFSGVAAILCIPMLTDWYGAGIRADTYNQINGTQYTQAQFYYAPDVIDPSLNQEK